MAQASGAGLVRLIGLLKVIKALALIGSLAVVLHLLHHDPFEILIRWALTLHVDPDNKYLNALITKLLKIDARQTELLTIGVVVYALLFMVEGVGMLFERPWAEYLTIVETAGFIPVEVYEILKYVAISRVVVLGLNILVVMYLVVHVRQQRRAGCWH